MSRVFENIGHSNCIPVRIGGLKCLWVETGHKRRPLACIWINENICKLKSKAATTEKSFGNAHAFLLSGRRAG